MQIKLMSIFVDDQTKALAFYTDVLGFVKKQDFPVGEFKWLTVASPEEPEGPQVLLEPNNNPIARTFQEGIFQQGIAAASFFVGNVQQEYERLTKLGVRFTAGPASMGPTTFAVFDDTCGNLIQITQVG
jgi:catechol 2,3-dioxygenase-like lactoylglutathione lyase family enzyme